MIEQRPFAHLSSWEGETATAAQFSIPDSLPICDRIETLTWKLCELFLVVFMVNLSWSVHKATDCIIASQNAVNECVLVDFDWLCTGRSFHVSMAQFWLVLVSMQQLWRACFNTFSSSSFLLSFSCFYLLLYNVCFSILRPHTFPHEIHRQDEGSLRISFICYCCFPPKMTMSVPLTMDRLFPF